MSLQDKIKGDLKQSMINKDIEKRDLLRVVMGEFTRVDSVSKDLTDDQVISVIRKMIKNAEMMGNESEISILSTYLPQLLGEKQLETLIAGIISINKYTDIKDMGKVMGELKQKYGSTYDGKMASVIVRKMLS